MTLLVTGGAGYIGSHVVRLLRERGERVVIVDDLSTGHRDRVGDPLVELDIASPDASPRLIEVMRQSDVTGVVHFAALKDVGESVAHPERYDRVNVQGVHNVLAAMEHCGVRRLVFSSSAAVYGEVNVPRVDEATPCDPSNPYGASKLAGEHAIGAARDSWGLRAVALRYFNVAGAGWPDLADRGCNNLIPIVIDRLRTGRVPVVFGDDHATPDGTCVRDYIHVMDLARAHVDALDALAGDQALPAVLNLGTGTGASVLDVVAAVAGALGAPASVDVVPRRQGDPAAVVADPARAREALGWSHVHDLEAIVSTAVGASLARPVVAV